MDGDGLFTHKRVCIFMPFTPLRLQNDILMSMNFPRVIVLLTPIALIALGVWYWTTLNTLPSMSTSLIPPATYENLLEVDVPLPNASVQSPLTISGKARGSWYFEASFPVILLDGSGKTLAQQPAQAQSDWMTSDYVPFTVTLTFAKPSTASGTLILKNDNPSGDPAKDKILRIPVTFGTASD